MAKKLYEEASVQAIANAIREKNGGATKYKIAELAAADRDVLDVKEKGYDRLVW